MRLREQIREASQALAGHLPEERDAKPVQRMRDTANLAIEGILSFEQSEITTGRSLIDWSGNQLRHESWRVHLNTFHQLGPLATCYHETAEEQYAEAAHDFIADWLEAHPVTDDGKWCAPDYASPLSCANRIGALGRRGGWLENLPYFLHSPAFTDEFVQRMVESVRAQLVWLRENVPIAINWRIAAADCFVASSLRLPFVPEAAAWQRFGVSTINDAWYRQVLPDGVHYEIAPGYHTWMSRVMTMYWLLGKTKPELSTAMTVERLREMWDYALLSTYPNGQFNCINDSKGNRYGPRDTKAHGQHEVSKLRTTFRRSAGLDDQMPAKSKTFPDAGMSLMRSDWSEDATYVTFDAATWGGNHSHLSRNSIQIYTNRRAMLCDPGSITYDASDPLAAYGKSTPAHNTCNLDGLNQCGHAPQKRNSFHGPGYDLVYSVYDAGYWQGDLNWGFQSLSGGVMGSHCRILFWVHDLGMLVFDSISRPRYTPTNQEEKPPSLECNWQFCEGGEVSVSADGTRISSQYQEGGLLALVPFRPETMEPICYEGSRTPLRGWVAGHKPAPQVCYRLPQMSSTCAEIWTFFLPYAGQQPPCREVRIWKSEADRFNKLTLHDPRTGFSDEFHWSYRMEIMLGARDDIDTDAGMLHTRRDDRNELIKACAVDATYCNPLVDRPSSRRGIIAWSA